jgi:hypothetical protein
MAGIIQDNNKTHGGSNGRLYRRTIQTILIAMDSFREEGSGFTSIGVGSTNPQGEIGLNPRGNRWHLINLHINRFVFEKFIA